VAAAEDHPQQTGRTTISTGVANAGVIITIGRSTKWRIGNGRRAGLGGAKRPCATTMRCGCGANAGRLWVTECRLANAPPPDPRADAFGTADKRPAARKAKRKAPIFMTGLRCAVWMSPC